MDRKEEVEDWEDVGDTIYEVALAGRPEGSREGLVSWRAETEPWEGSFVGLVLTGNLPGGAAIRDVEVTAPGEGRRDCLLAAVFPTAIDEVAAAAPGVLLIVEGAVN